ncbi:hypothetical protein GGS23DRAFT_430743 [Durotheca rogersii]|uniref:uncharacterized protein n=1 Tax=Durotheca rogersii TaxID=419775 RepID=UPI00221F9609|nr:uncharacterized protein GGS23DRAFT_430743 [Durotheca rogersii]KAI5865512.1 hypothetical protein GGS23DRAFT_430743 [Durotheca rogersii]
MMMSFIWYLFRRGACLRSLAALARKLRPADWCAHRAPLFASARNGLCFCTSQGAVGMYSADLYGQRSVGRWADRMAWYEPIMGIGRVLLVIWGDDGAGSGQIA